VELQLDKPLGDRLRLQLELKVLEDLDDRQNLSLHFHPLTLNMKKIWSFYEFRESRLRVKVVYRDPDCQKRITSTEVKSAVGNICQATWQNANSH
jgi:hypothetical protein